MWARRLAWAAGIALVAGGIPILLTAGGEILDTSTDDPSLARRRTAVGGVAMSSAITADARFYWEMDERPRALVDLDEIISGGPGPDGIPPIDEPAFVTPGEANEWLDPQEPVLAFEHNGVARAYPIQILTWHEIVNDVVGGEPVAVSFCPLCNAAIVYSRRVDPLIVDFGTSGRLYRSDLVMYDRQTKSMWPQIEGTAVVGPLIGRELTALPSSMVSWTQWRADHPDGEVLSNKTGFSRPYGRNPYAGYDAPGAQPFLFLDETDARLPAMERVLAVEHDGGATVYPYERLADGAPTVVNATAGDRPIVVLYTRGTRSALDDDQIARGRDVGATGVFDPVVNGTRLRFESRGGAFVDAETGSRWSILGKAVAGPLKGSALDPVVHTDTFWFAWAAFVPETTIWSG